MPRSRKIDTNVRVGVMTKIDDAELRRRLLEDRCYLRPGETMVLHIWHPSADERARSIVPFRWAERWAHLFGDDADELVKVAKIFGVRRPFVHRRGLKGQHVDLCGGPLDRLANAIDACEKRGL